MNIEQLALSVASYGLVRLALAWFDSATFSFLALLVNKLKKKHFKNMQKLQNLKEKLPDFAVKTFKFILCFWSYVKWSICNTWKASLVSNDR